MVLATYPEQWYPGAFITEQFYALTAPLVLFYLLEVKEIWHWPSCWNITYLIIKGCPQNHLRLRILYPLVPLPGTTGRNAIRTTENILSRIGSGYCLFPQTDVLPFPCSTLLFNLFSIQQTYSFLFPFSALITELLQRIVHVHCSHKCLHLIAQVIHHMCSPGWGSTGRFLAQMLTCEWKTGNWWMKHFLFSLYNHEHRGHKQKQQQCIQPRNLISMELCQWKSGTQNSLKTKHNKAQKKAMIQRKTILIHSEITKEHGT